MSTLCFEFSKLRRSEERRFANLPLNTFGEHRVFGTFRLWPLRHLWF